MFLRAEENNRVRKYVQALENNLTDMKTFRRIMNLVCNHFQLRFNKGHLQYLQNRIKEEFK